MKNKLCSVFFLCVGILLFQPLALGQQSAAAKPASTPKRLYILGDSLTEGYGVSQQAAFPALLQKTIESKKLNWKVVSSGSSGSTAASGPGRIKWMINPKNKERPDLILVLLGSNDGLRGFKPEETKKNLVETIKLIQKEKIAVILGQLYMPPNYGKEYTEKFAKIFPEIAKETNIPLAGFLLDRVAGDPKLNLPDGIHPNEKGHVRVAENIFKSLESYLK